MTKQRVRNLGALLFFCAVTTLLLHFARIQVVLDGLRATYELLSTAEQL